MDTPTSIVPPAAPAAALPVPYGGAPASPPQNVLAWVSLGLALGFVFFSVLTSIPAIICGHIARAQIRRTGEQGGAAALTGLVLGYVFTALTLAGIAVFVTFFIGIAVAAGATSTV
ncbi:DUF4190 domain-containing protein [Agromyces albus]|uniref:DUF4190 domain-containing protein n=1 Tax=Agromyces albus TaxID=205332 RepID=A0A4Q2L4U7_9MICO|nr:DUF4190 domain-containing protein [Agromyces albus]RXZ72507.1 DUF4190 domain-containing protein [Agromyces albus]